MSEMKTELRVRSGGKRLTGIGRSYVAAVANWVVRRREATQFAVVATNEMSEEQGRF